MPNQPSKWETYQRTMVVAPDLCSAAKANDVAELARLLDEGATLNAADARGYSALMLAAYAGHVEAASYLLRRGADPNSADASGNSVLMGAAFKGHLELVKELLLFGADPRARNHAGLDALDFANQFGRGEVSRLLTPLRFTATPQPLPTASK